MKHIDIVIATRNRYEKLMRTIRSIPEKDFITTWITFDGDLDGFNRICESDFEKREIIIDFSFEQRGAVKARNDIISKFACEDGILYATDDMTFEPNAIENAFNAFNSHFPDDDGVVGLVQLGNKKYHPTGVALVGQKFLQRYPNKQLFWPGYYHFACQEIYWLASKLGKFHQESTAVIRHYNPFILKDEMDETHKEARIHKGKDHALMKARQMSGTIWGNR